MLIICEMNFNFQKTFLTSEYEVIKSTVASQMFMLTRMIASGFTIRMAVLQTVQMEKLLPVFDSGSEFWNVKILFEYYSFISSFLKEEFLTGYLLFMNQK